MTNTERCENILDRHEIYRDLWKVALDLARPSCEVDRLLLDSLRSLRPFVQPFSLLAERHPLVGRRAIRG